MHSPLTRFAGVTVTPDNVADLGLSPLAAAVVSMGATAMIDGYRVRLGAAIAPSPRTTAAPVAVSCAPASLRERVAAKVRARSAALLAERQRAAADASQHPAAQVASPVPVAELSADERLAAIVRNPPSPEETLIAALERDAARKDPTR